MAGPVTITAVIALAVLLATLVVFGVWGYRTANRLDRLHVRYDLSWQALEGALARRAVVARAVAAAASVGLPSSSSGHLPGSSSGCPTARIVAGRGRSGPHRRWAQGGVLKADGAADSAVQRLAALADAAERAPRHAREACENKLSAALAMVDPASVPSGLIVELGDAEVRVLLARRFHNDAVRDTLALREQRMVRLLRLGGTAALPSYFEIAERSRAVRRGEHPAADRRTSARVVLLDESGAVLLLCGSDPSLAGRLAPRWWFTVGGQVGETESLGQAATRELAEETGLRVDPAGLIGPIWRRDAVFDFNGAEIDSEEFFFVHRTQRFEPSIAGRTELENRYIHGHRWCGPGDISALAAAGETVYPLQLAELLTEAVALAGAPDGPRQLLSIR
jgi:8-oxo-dGTP pyrophosphatase MutT (NUDIX family)